MASTGFTLAASELNRKAEDKADELWHSAKTWRAIDALSCALS